MTDPRPWGEIDLAPGASTAATIGSLHLTVKRTRNEIWLRSERTDGAEDADGAEAEGVEVDWDRWVVPNDARIHLRPAAPDRLLVVSHEYPFHLPGRRAARVFVRMPVFVQVVVSSPAMDEILALDEPSQVLSDTWWGNIESGELAYWHTTTARAEVSDDLFVPHIAMCPIQLDNQSGEPLHVERFSVRALHLSLFRSGSRVWTDEVKVTYLAAAEGSHIEFGGVPPVEQPGGERVAEPRVPIRKGFQARTFDRLRSFSMLGG